MGKVLPWLSVDVVVLFGKMDLVVVTLQPLPLPNKSGTTTTHRRRGEDEEELVLFVVVAVAVVVAVDDISDKACINRS